MVDSVFVLQMRTQLLINVFLLKEFEENYFFILFVGTWKCNNNEQTRVWVYSYASTLKHWMLLSMFLASEHLNQGLLQVAQAEKWKNNEDVLLDKPSEAKRLKIFSITWVKAQKRGWICVAFLRFLIWCPYLQDNIICAFQKCYKLLF